MKTQRDETRKTYDRLSRWYDFISGASERPARLRGLQALSVKRGERVLEVGCGTGEALSALDSCAGANQIFGLDLSFGMLQVATQKLQKNSCPRVLCLQGDGVRLPFSSHSFDALFTSFTLEIFSATESSAVLLECKRVLRPNGRIVVVSLLQTERPNAMENLYVWAHRLSPRVIDCRPIPIKEIVKNAGFEQIHMQKMSMWGLTVGVLSAVQFSTS